MALDTPTPTTPTTNTPTNTPPLRLTAGNLLVCGALAGVCGKTVTAPLDRVRILYQVNEYRPFTAARAYKTGETIVKTEGVRGLWRGNGVALLRVIPYSAIVFFTYDRYAAFGSAVAPGHDLSTRFLAGACAGATATIATYPLDLIRARQAAHWGRVAQYAFFAHTLRDIARSEGSGALFSGLRPTLMGIVPYAGLSFGLFESLKAAAKVRHGWKTDAEVSTGARLAAGAVAGVVAQVAAYPLHVIRRRMQVSPDKYPTVRAAYTKIAAEGVAQGLYKGLSVTWIKGPLAMAVTFTIHDYLKQRLREWYASDVAVEEEVLPSDTYTSGTEISQLPTLDSVVAGGAAGALAKTVIAPGDRIKILYQVNTQRVFSLSSAVRTGQTIVRTTGIFGLWRGHSATLIRVVPSAAITYSCFPAYEAGLLRATGRDHDVTSRFFAGAAAGATSTAITYPLDLLRARMAAHWDTAPRYPNYISAVGDVVQKEGYLALWGGLRPTLVGIVPYAGLSFATFETLKSRIRRQQGLDSDRDIPMRLRLAAGAVAGLTAQSVTYPLDILRRRMQVHGARARMPDDTVGALRHIARTEGIVKGLYKGLSMNWLKGPIAVAVSFSANDQIKQMLQQMHDRGAALDDCDGDDGDGDDDAGGDGAGGRRAGGWPAES